MKKSMLIMFVSGLMLSASSCISDEPDFSTEVVRVENSVVSYYDKADNHWYCREALIYVSHKPRKVMFPEQYEGDIVPGTRIEYNCNNVTDYYKDGRRISINWEDSRL